MISWLANNLGTIVISIILIVMVVFIIRKLINDKRQGISSCGGNCAHCNMCSGIKKQK